MIQIRYLRTFTPRGETQPKPYDKQCDPDVLVEDHAELFKNLDQYIEQIPGVERYNCYYTLGHSTGGKTRNFVRQDVLPFDIDGITVADDGSFDQRYIHLLVSTLGLDLSKTAVVFSGNGLQFLVQLDDPITKEDAFKELKKTYSLMAGKISAAYLDAGLKAVVDTSACGPNRLFRLPGTKNIKPNKPERMARILYGNLEKQGFQIGPPKAADKKVDSLTIDQLKYFKIDTPAVEAGCSFLKWAKANPDEVTEPQWYAALSILGRLDDGKAKAHEYSRGHRDYSRQNTDAKLEQAISTSGPRTCDGVDAVWGMCSDCPNYRKVNSPVSVRSESFVSTEHSGFHLAGSRGNLIPQYEDLRRFFQREQGYVVHEKTGICYVFDGKRFHTWSELQLRNFGDRHFNPKPLERVVTEFAGWVNRTNLVSNEFFTNSIRGKINFANGILDIKTKALEPHSKDHGFLYVLPYDYNPSAKSPEFDALMQRVTVDDRELEELLLEFTGYAICDTGYWLQKALLLKGRGANGKSTFLEIVKRLAGGENVSCLSLSDLQSETARSGLEGKLLNLSDEMPSYAIKNTELFKKLLGGSVTARRLFHDATNIDNYAKFFFSCNEIPSTYDTSEGLFRRLAIVPFEAHFKEGERDHGILSKIEKELPGIFNRIFAAYQRLVKRGYLIESKSAHQELANYREANDLVGEWVKGSLHIEKSIEGEFTETKVLYSDFSSKMLQQGEKPISRNRFMTQLRNHIPQFQKRYVASKKIGGHVVPVLYGVKIGYSDAEVPDQGTVKRLDNPEVEMPYI